MEQNRMSITLSYR
uniref:Uncharacterized protein n=1 Tax=Anguilla anguilla TaxID=7936 RepID=A0A0E9RZ41_ANGAN